MKNPKKLEVYSVQDILNMKFDEDKWLIEDLIHTETLTVISGQPSSFKTIACVHLALVVSGGGSFLGKFKALSRRKVLILDKESRWKDVLDRLKGFNAIGSGEMFFSLDEEVRLDDESWIDSLIYYIKGNKIGLLVIDSLIRFHRGDENDSRQMSAILANLKKIIKATKANIIFIHHHRKESSYGSVSSNSLRGSSDIFAAVDCHLSLSRPKKEEKIISFSHMKSRQSAELEPFSVEVIFDKKENGEKTISLRYIGKYDSRGAKIEEVKEAVRSVIKERNDEPSFKEIEEKLSDSFAGNAIRSALLDLKRNGEVVIRSEAHNQKFYSLVESSVDKTP